MVEQFVREVKLQTYLNDPHIIKIYGYFEDQFHVYTVLQPALNKDLLDVQQKNHEVNELQIAKILKEVCLAVKTLHANSIIHRDIKP